MSKIICVRLRDHLRLCGRELRLAVAAAVGKVDAGGDGGGGEEEQGDGRAHCCQFNRALFTGLG